MQSKISLFKTLRRRRLPVGPKLICLPDENASTVSIQIWLPAGTSAEKKDEAGLAHFLEHMIFKGSRNLGVGELASRVEAAGGDINAYTMSDATYYYLACLPETAEDCLEMLADAVWWPRLDQTEADRERGVILAEIDRSMDQPDQVLQHRLFEKAYGKDHPYGWPIMGSRRAVSGFGRRELRRFHSRCYAPSRSIVAVSGRVDMSAIRGVLREKFRAEGELPSSVRQSRRIRVPAPRPVGAAPRLSILRERSGLAHLVVAYEIPSFTDTDAPALEVLAMILGMGESSRLYKKMCVETSLMHEVSAENFFSLGAGLLFLGGTAASGQAASAAEMIVRIGREIVRTSPATPEELERVRLNFLSDMEFRREGLSGYARIAGYAELLAGDARFAEVYLNRLMKVGAKEVSRVAERYLRPEGATSGVLIPLNAGGGTTRKELLRGILRGFSEENSEASGPTGARKKTGTAARERGEALASRLGRRGPKRVRRGEREVVFRLPGGARLIVQPGGVARVFAISAVCLGGQRLEDKKRAGLHYLMSNLAAQATRSMDSDKLAGRIDGLGAVLEGFSGRNSIGLSGSCISPVSDELIEIFIGVLTEPAFSQGDLSLTLREIRAERRSDMDDLSDVSRLRAMALLYGDHPFGRHPLGDPRALSRIDPRALRRAWRRCVVPGNLVLSVAGDVDPAAISKKLGRLLKGWTGRSLAWRPPLPPPPPVVPARGRSRRQVVEGASQSHIQLAFLGANFSDSRRYALSVLTTALGSQGGGLFWELRERRGLAYAVFASSEEGIDPGPVSFYAATAPEAEEEAVEVIHSELARVRENGLGQEEFDRAKAFLIGEHLRSLQRAGAKASEAAFDTLYGLEREGTDAFRKKIQAVRAEDVLAVARTFLAPEKGAMVRLGPPIRDRRRRRASR
jgi:zinc protease